MADSPLINSLIAQQGAQGSQDPALLALMPKLSLAQSMIQQGMDTSAAYPVQALARLAQALGGNYLLGNTTSAIGNTLGQRQSALAQALTGGSSGGQPQPTISGAPPTGTPGSTGAAVSPGQPAAPGGTGAPGVGSMGVAGTAAPAALTPFAQMQAVARRLIGSGDPVLMQRGNEMLLQATQAQSQAQITAGEKLAEGGVNLDPATGMATATPGYSGTMAGIKGAETAATAGATKAAEAQYAGPIADAQEQARQNHAAAIAANTAAGTASGTTQTIATPQGPMLMTGTQALQYARTGVLPNGVAPAGALPSPGVGAPTPSGGQVGASDLPLPDADGAIAHANASIPQAQAGGALLQDPKVREAQIAEIGASGKRFADAQSRLQNLGQIQTLLQNPAVITGAGGDQIQALRQAAIQGYTLIGKQPPADLVSGVASAEAIKAAANSLAIETSKDEGAGTPRISIFNAISQNKPGLESSAQGNLVRVLAMQQAAKREADFGNFAPTYYQQPGNFNKQDAEQAFAKLHPVSEYSAQIYPQTPQDFASIPVGQIWIDSKGNPHVKNAPIAPGGQ